MLLLMGLAIAHEAEADNVFLSYCWRSFDIVYAGQHSNSIPDMKHFYDSMDLRPDPTFFKICHSGLMNGTF